MSATLMYNGSLPKNDMKPSRNGYSWKNPEAGAVSDGKETTKLYGVMSNEEYQSLMSNGMFTPYDMAMEDKWFATTQADAEEWAKYFYPDGNYRMVEIEVNTDSLSYMYYNSYLDGIGPAYCSPIDILNKAIQIIKGIK